MAIKHIAVKPFLTILSRFKRWFKTESCKIIKE